MGEDPTTTVRFSVSLRGDSEEFALALGGAKEECRLENVTGDSEGTLEREDSVEGGERGSPCLCKSGVSGV